MKQYWSFRNVHVQKIHVNLGNNFSSLSLFFSLSLTNIDQEMILNRNNIKSLFVFRSLFQMPISQNGSHSFNPPIAQIAPVHAMNSVDHATIDSPFVIFLVRYHVHSIWAEKFETNSSIKCFRHFYEEKNPLKALTTNCEICRFSAAT